MSPYPVPLYKRSLRCGGAVRAASRWRRGSWDARTAERGAAWLAPSYLTGSGRRRRGTVRERPDPSARSVDHVGFNMPTSTRPSTATVARPIGLRELRPLAAAGHPRLSQPTASHYQGSGTADRRRSQSCGDSTAVATTWRRECVAELLAAAPSDLLGQYGRADSGRPGTPLGAPAGPAQRCRRQRGRVPRSRPLSSGQHSRPGAQQYDRTGPALVSMSSPRRSTRRPVRTSSRPPETCWEQSCASPRSARPYGSCAPSQAGEESSHDEQCTALRGCPSAARA